MPTSLAGYTVSIETSIEPRFCAGGTDALVTGGTLYSFRMGGALDATLQVSPFKAGFDWRDDSVQAGIAGQIGESIMRLHTYGRERVYVGTGDRSLVFVWFRDNLLHVLLTHDIRDPDPLVNALVALA
ncbi:MAG: hypothetical protein ACYDAC_07020 [Candidatus Dormibacteria bacterium]